MGAVSLYSPYFDPRIHGTTLCEMLAALNGKSNMRYANGELCSFSLWWPSTSDRRATQAFDLLRDHGWRLSCTNTARSGRSYRIQIEVPVKRSSLDQCDWLDTSVKGKTWDAYPGPSGVVRIVRPRSIAQVAYNCDAGPIVVCDAFKRELQELGDAGIRFEMTTTVKAQKDLTDAGAKETSWSELGLEPWWVLTSASMLPRPICKLVDIDGNEFRDGDYSNYCFVSKGVYEYGFLRYSREQVKQFAGRDVLVTREKFGLNMQDGAHSLIVSQRFRTLSMERKWPYLFRPVIVEEAAGTRKPDLPVETPPEFRKYMEPV